jgi:hypothetical protein
MGYARKVEVLGLVQDESIAKSAPVEGSNVSVAGQLDWPSAGTSVHLPDMEQDPS